VILRKWLDRAVIGWTVLGGGRYPRSKYEMGFGFSVGLLVAAVFAESRALFWAGISSSTVWLAAYLWAFWLSFRAEAHEGDLNYDKRGKYRLAKEYWNTESFTAARKRKGK
jgi:hypothetical protein